MDKTIIKFENHELKVDFGTLAVSNFFDEFTFQITAKYFYNPLSFNYFFSDKNTRRISNNLYQDTKKIHSNY